MAGAPAQMGLRKSPELAINPRALEKPFGKAARPPAVVYQQPQVDVSTQVDIHPGAYHIDWDRRATPLYSREDIKEQYCITSRQLDAVERSGSGFFGCLTNRGPSPCSSTKASILSACVRSAPSDENLFDAPYPRRHFPVMYQPPYSTYPRHPSRYDYYEYYDDWDVSSYAPVRRWPKPCKFPDPKRYMWVPEDEETAKLEGPRSVLSIPPQVPSQLPKTKHVSFARSHTLTSFEMSPRPHNQERLIDSQPTSQGPTTATLPAAHLITTAEPRIVVLEKQPKRGAMKTQATQTDIPSLFRGRRIPVTLSPRTIHRVKMVSQGAQTNGILNGRKLTKSYSEAGQLGTPLGANGTAAKDETDHEPLQRTQSEEPPRSPFMINSPPHSPVKVKAEIPNGDIEHVKDKDKRKDAEPEDKEIFIDFKPAPVSPDARAMLMPKTYRRMVSLQKTYSDGEIRVERRELIGETGEPSYPHSCRRNYQDMWSGALHTPVQFSSTPDDLSSFRVTSPQDEYHEEEFHENIVRRGLYRKRSVSLEDGVQFLSTSEYILPRSLPTSPTSPTSVSVPTRIIQSPKGRASDRRLLHAGRITGITSSPFASSDSLTNDVTRDHSDGIWNESQATVLQADSLALLTPSSRRRHMLVLQHQQRSSMDTEALDVEDELDISPSSPRVLLEPATPVTTTPTSIEPTLITTNGRPRSGLFRRSPLPPYSQPHSQSSSEFGLSLARTDSGGRTDISETSTTDDYITANTSTGTGTTTGTSATTSSWSKPPYPALGGVPSTSTTGTVADGSSFESASSVYSLARSEAVAEETISPPPPVVIKEEAEIPFALEQPASPAKSTSSSSSGSYDLEDAMPDTAQESFQSASISGHAAEIDIEIEHKIYQPSPGFPESPPERPPWVEDERRRRKSSFSIDFIASTEPEHDRTSEVILDNMEVSPTLSYRHKSRAKSAASRSPHRNNKKRDSISQQLVRSPQEEWRELPEDSGHVQTSDDSSCSHHYHHHHYHHHMHREGSDSNNRHRRTRESPRRKSGSYVSTRRRSNEDKNAALTGSLPRRRSRAIDDSPSSRLSPGGRYQRSPGHNGHTAIVLKSPSPETRLKAVSAESLRSVSPGSDSVFYSEATDQYMSMLDTQHCHHCGREVAEDIVQPPAGFADSPDGQRSTTKQPSHRLYKKFDKRFRSEDRGERRHHRGSIGRSDVRAKSEERGTRPSSRGFEDGVRKRLQARSTDASMEILTGREDEDTYMEPYTSGEWIYIGDLEESHVWRRPDSRDSEEDIGDVLVKERRSSQESTESEKCFKKKYQAATHRMVHRKSSGEMYKRIQRKSFGNVSSIGWQVGSKKL